jgi:hypothetical protein
MNHFKWFMSAMTIIILFTVLVGFLYLQNEINGLNPSSPTATPTPNDNITPSYVTPPNTTTTITTYGGTTLACAWGSSNDGASAFLFITNDSSIININYLNITNIGNATAYVSGLRIQAYYQNGTQALDTTIRLDASGVYSSMPTPKPVPFTLSPSQSLFGNPFTERATDQHINQVGTTDNDIFASYTITPV